MSGTDRTEGAARAPAPRAGSTRSALLRFALHVVLTAALIVMLMPMVWLVAGSFKNSDDLFHYTFFPPPDRLSTENYEKLFGSPTLQVNDVLDWPALAAKLRREAEADRGALGQRVWEALRPEDRQRLDRAASAGQVSPDDERALLRALNRALAGPDLLRREHFEHLKLRVEAQPLVERFDGGLGPAEAHRLNRFVLETAYPQEVARAVPRVPFGRYIVNSLFVASAVVMIQVLFSSMGGFALAKYEFRLKKPVMLVMLATMTIPAQVLLAPQYELIYRMGLMDSHAGLIVPGIVSVFGIFLFSRSMQQVPDELLEAGRMDGCTEFGLYWHIALPVSRPMVGAFCLMAFMGTWNSFLWPQLILHTQQLFTLPIGLNLMVGTYSQQYGIRMAGTVLSILPAMGLFILLQREFISGLTAGAVKG